MNVVLLEDNHFHRNNLKLWLSKDRYVKEVKFVKTEMDFRERMQEFATKPPSLFIMDVMVKIAETEDVELGNVVIPPEIMNDDENIFRAGFRCLDLVRSHPALKHIPIILISVLGSKGLEKSLSTLGNNEVFIEKNKFEKELELQIRNIAKTGKVK